MKLGHYELQPLVVQYFSW